MADGGHSDPLHLIALVVAILAFVVIFVLAVLFKKNDSLTELAGWAGLGTGAWLASRA